eukprot:248284-Pelagomonas_calceolata.AAC.1
MEREKRPRSSEAKLQGGGWIVSCIPLCLALSNGLWRISMRSGVSILLHSLSVLQVHAACKEYISTSSRGGMEGVEGELVASALGWGSVVLLSCFCRGESSRPLNPDSESTRVNSPGMSPFGARTRNLDMQRLARLFEMSTVPGASVIGDLHMDLKA